jgi:hypothetical protein
MKKLYAIFLLSIGFAGQSQIVNIPDPIFKAELVAANADDGYTAADIDGNYITIDTNADGEIQLTEALTVYRLYLVQPSSDLTGIKSFTNLRELEASFLALESLDVSGMTYLESINCSDNFLTSLNVSGCTALYMLSCDFNELTSLNLQGLPNIQQVLCGSNNIHNLNLSGLSSLEFFSGPLNDMETIDVSGCSSLDFLHVAFNSLTSLDLSGCHVSEADIQENFITQLRIKNGFDDTEAYIDFYNNPMEYICADDVEIESYQTQMTLNGIENGEVNSYCSFTPGGNYYTIQGTNRFQPDATECSPTSPICPGLKFEIHDGISTIGHYIANGSGNYSISLPPANYSISPVLENPAYFTVTPASIAVLFPSPANPIDQDFCIAPNGIHPDLDIAFLPMTSSVPGFDPEYRIVYHNKGNQTQSGTVTLTFENEVLALLESVPAGTQTGNLITWTFSDLAPSESGFIDVTMHLNAPTDTPAVNIDESLDFSAAIAAAQTDETPDDNVDAHSEIVVGSFDPNDKTCLEGTVVSPEIVGDYVHYLIRFENTGTFPATNIVVRDEIDLERFDISTLIPTGGSHSFVTRVSNNVVEFIFEDIDLPFDDANNDGYVAFRIKTRDNLVVGNSFSNTAAIYFDFNLPIITNTATTTIQLLSTPDFEFGEMFALYPNPVKSILNIEAKTGIEIKSVQIFNMLGQLVIAGAGNLESIDVSSLRSGTYFFKVNTNNGIATTKFIKE